jgi:hypothetical protein
MLDLFEELVDVEPYPDGVEVPSEEILRTVDYLS